MSRYLFRILALAAFTSPAAAEVLDADVHGFTVGHSVTLPVTRDVAWAAVVRDVSQWWNGEHTVSGDPANLYIDPVPLGCFCERLGDSGGIVHLTVTFVNPGVMLRLTGGLGPIGLMGANGNLTFEFEEAGDDPGRTILRLEYAVGGYLDGGLDRVAPSVDAVLGEQLTRLADWVAGQAAP